MEEVDLDTLVLERGRHAYQEQGMNVLEAVSAISPNEKFNDKSSGGAAHAAGLDINLKFGDYSEISILGNTFSGNDRLVMSMGLGVVGSLHTNDVAATLDEVTPIARLLSEPEVVLVRTGSPHDDLASLVRAWRACPWSS